MPIRKDGLRLIIWYFQMKRLRPLGRVQPTAREKEERARICRLHPVEPGGRCGDGNEPSRKQSSLLPPVRGGGSRLLVSASTGWPMPGVYWAKPRPRRALRDAPESNQNQVKAAKHAFSLFLDSKSLARFVFKSARSCHHFDSAASFFFSASS